ncbi:MAG: transposase [Deltaproteobacteria bacterium]|nr:transposase [Deltaproteobacteria bacterium]
MARPIRIEYEGGFFHVTSRGNARQEIFLEAGDYRLFLEVLGDVVERYRWIIHAYCLMGNHYHLLIETPQANLSLGMRQLNGVFTQKYNRRHGRTGHLFQGRYKAFIVDKDAYLLELSRYIVLNPVRAGMVESAEEWPWSSYRATVGIETAEQFLHTDWLLSLFFNLKSEARRLYMSFVHEGIGIESPLKSAKGGLFVGNDSFVERFREAPAISGAGTESVRREKYAARPPIDEIFTSHSRDDAIYNAVEIWGYTLKEVADYAELHYSRVSRIVFLKKEEKKAKNKT